MGYNRSGTTRKLRLRRAKRELERLAKKAPSQPETETVGQTASRPQPEAPRTESK